MKKLVFLGFLIFFALNSSMLTAADATTVSESEKIAVVEEKSVFEEESHLLEMRVREIREMDKSELTAEEREELRKELKYIREQARRPVIYISSGVLVLAIILILLLR